MIREYKTLFTVKIAHDYYKSGLSEDFTFAPTLSCERLMKNYGLVFRDTGNGFAVYFKKVGGEIRNRIETDLKFDFCMVSTNPSFEYFTELENTRPRFGRGVYYFSNLNEEGDLDSSTELAIFGAKVSDADLTSLATKLISIPVPGEFSSVKLFNYQIAKGEVELSSEDISGQEIYKLFFKELPSGFYGIRWPVEVIDDDFIYYSKESKRPFGFVEIYKNGTVDYDSPIQYTLSFKRKEQRWSYYLVDREKTFVLEPDGTVDLSIQYLKPEEGSFPEEVKFNQILPAGLEPEQAATISNVANAVGIPPKRIYLFKSDLSLPRFEFLDVNLSLENGSELLPRMPLPKLNSIKAETFINL